MSATTIGGDDEGHQLSNDEKDRLEKSLRKEARALLRKGKTKERRERENRAKNIWRRESKRADHH